MGIKQLNKMIKRASPSAFSEKTIYDLFGKSVAIDSSIFIYKFRYGSKDPDDVSHLNGFLQKTCYFLRNGVLPIYVFDGVPPVEKRYTLNKRVRQKDKIEKRINDLVSQRKDYSTLTSPEEIVEIRTIEEKIRKLTKQVTHVNRNHRNECKYFLQLLGIPVVESCGEAEQTCAHLQMQGIVDYTFTEDTDALTFGAPKVIRHQTHPEKKVAKGERSIVSKKFVQVDLEQIKEGMQLTMDEFIDFCILCGCDYCPTIPSIGPVTALNLIQTHSNIETVIENIKHKHTIPEHFHYEKARKIFKNEHPVKGMTFNLKPIQYSKFKDFLIKEKRCTVSMTYKWLERYNASVVNYFSSQSFSSQSY